jgi:hypothetical protein
MVHMLCRVASRRKAPAFSKMHTALALIEASSRTSSTLPLPVNRLLSSRRVIALSAEHYVVYLTP